MPDEQLTFGFADEPPTPETFAPTRLARAAWIAERSGSLARQGVYVGTSSWKYPGWLGQVYDPARYATRGRLSERKFRDDCLAEYACVFPTVCGDFAFYQFPSAQMWQGIFERLPAGYRFALKVPEHITMVRFPDQPRYGERAGLPNRDFMDAGLVESLLLEKLRPYRDKLGPLIFEFTAIHDSELCKPAVFAEALDGMLSRLPCDEFELSVEVRNPQFLPAPEPAPGPTGDPDRTSSPNRPRSDKGQEQGRVNRSEQENRRDAARGADEAATRRGGDQARGADSRSSYLDVLRKHNVGHVLNSWTRMPPVHEQMRIPGIFTARHVVSRWLLKPGRTYAQAVEAFTPYERIKEPYPQGRQALRDLIEQFVPDERVFYAFVNNRFEGSAIETIENVLGAYP